MGSILKFSRTEHEHLSMGPIVNYIDYNYGFYPIEDDSIIVLEFNGNVDDHPDLFNLLKQHKDTDVKFLLCYVSDPLADFKLEETKKYLYNLIEKERIFFLTSNTLLIGDDIISFDYFLEESTWVSYHDIFSIQPNDLGYVSQDIEIDELDTIRTKKFLSFNRNVNKKHRLNLLQLYLSHLKKDSLFSFLFFEEAMCEIYNKEDYVDNWLEHIPIELDTNGELTQFRTSDTFRKDLFLDTCINIVTETSFDFNELFISEKILKPILMYQPFIVLGPVDYLKRLKRYGFKTFSDFWDESYDDISDDTERFNKVRELILSLNEMSIEEMNELYQKTKEICIFNRQLHQRMSINSIPKILERIQNEW